jgi:hypothetical protein
LAREPFTPEKYRSKELMKNPGLPKWRGWRHRFLVTAAVLALAACSSTPPAQTEGDAEEAAQAALAVATERLLRLPTPPAPWQPLALPAKRFAPFEAQGNALRVRADSSVSILRQRIQPGIARPVRLSFDWKVEGLPNQADLADVDKTDSPVGVMIAFDGDRARWTPRTHRLSELTRLLTGEELPYATLAYVWSEKYPPGTVIPNPRTDRIRKLVVDSGVAGVGQWQHHQRDVRADFRRVFGEEPGPITSVALMTDTDNTRSRLTAWYGPLKMELAPD